MRCHAEVGLVDRLRGGPVPDTLKLEAVVVSCNPGADGILYGEEDVLSLEGVELTLGKEGHWLRNDVAVVIPLRHDFQKAFLCLKGEKGEPFATGAIHIRGNHPMPQVIEIAAGELVLHQLRTH